MNERIKELHNLACRMDMEQHPDAIPDGERIQQRFAELIVAECIKQINKVEKKGDAHLGGGYFYDGTRLCRDAIKQHFGVKE